VRHYQGRPGNGLLFSLFCGVKTVHEPKIAYMESSPKLAGKARQFGASYRRIALVELEPGFEGRPAMISERAHGVARILREETVSVGATARSYGYRLREEYKAAADVILG
jgi:hypothetical protein